MKKTMRILAIGNSFAEDALVKLYDLLENEYETLRIAFLYIGGASLSLHAMNMKEETQGYEFYDNKQGKWEIFRNYTMKDALNETWDIITLQQASGYSGIKESYEPYLSELITYIKNHSKAMLMWHQTWSYATDSTHEHFKFYQYSQKQMTEDIERSLHLIKTKKEIVKIIPVGAVIQALRDPSEQLTRDGFHLNEKGRMIASLVFKKIITQKNIDINDLDVEKEWISKEELEVINRFK